MIKRITSFVLIVLIIICALISSVFISNAAGKKPQVIKGICSAYTKSIKSKNFTLNAIAHTPITFKSSNKDVAAVSQGGVVEVKKSGVTYITITAKATAKYKSCVKKVKLNVESVSCKTQRITAGADCNDIVSIFKSQYRYPVEINAKAEFYDKKGNIIKTVDDTVFCLGSDRMATLHFSCPRNKNYKSIKYACYNVTYYSKPCSSKGTVYTSYQKNIKVKASRNDTSLTVNAVNKSQNNLAFNAYISVLYYDENGRLIGYHFSSPNPSVERAGANGSFTCSYPFVDGRYVTPYSYKVIVESAYNYKFN